MFEPIAAEPKIIHHDDHLLIVDKPPGLPTTAPEPTQPCLVSWARARFPEHGQLHPTSRLDACVSGVVTFALTKNANRHLLQARRTGAYERAYLGITVRDAAFDAYEWDWPIAIDPRNPKRRVAGAGKGGRAAFTRCEVAARTERAALLRLMPRTGRTHQLRVHAAEAGLSLFGDHTYGGERRLVLEDGSVVAARRAMLHCAQVRYPSPIGGEVLQFDAPAPDDMERAWLQLGGDRSALQL